jgi:hypothetical protein
LENSSAWAKAVGSCLGQPAGRGHFPLDDKQIRSLLAPLVDLAARDLFPALLASQAEILKRDITEELRAQQKQLKDKETDPFGTNPVTFVKNKSTGVVHALSSSSTPELGARATVCGWRFARQSNGVLLLGSDDCYKLLCEKCLPDERARRKRQLAVD